MTERETKIRQALGESSPATTAQINYMAALFQDLGFTREQRNAFLSAELGRACGPVPRRVDQV
jgi:hypothetical protein